MTLIWLNEDSFQVTFSSPAAASQWAAGLAQAAPLWLREVSAGFGQVLVMVDIQSDIAQIEQDCRLIKAQVQPTSSGVIRVPVCYDPSFGLDLAEVAQQTGLDIEQVIQRHYSQPLEVLAMGFAPGFGYLGAIDARLRLPRKSTPRTRIPAGSVAIAEQQSVIYPTETPGGWHILGRTPVSLIDYHPAPRTLFHVGAQVQFVPISLAEFEAWSDD